MTSKLFILIVENHEIYIPYMYSTDWNASAGGGDPVRISQRRLVQEKLEWLGYHILNKVYDDVKLFRCNNLPNKG